MEEEIFLLSIFYSLKYFLHLPPFLFCCAGRITPFHLFLSSTERFLSSLHVCGRPVLGECPKNLSLAGALTHSTASSVMETTAGDRDRDTGTRAAWIDGKG